jgi:hypothetical protein
MPDRDITCPCGEYEYMVSFEKRGKKGEPVFCPFCGADTEEEKIEELEEDEDE